MNTLYKATLLCMVTASHTLCMDEKTKEQPEKQSTFLKSFLNGAVAGSVEVMVSNPLIVLKNELILRAKAHPSHAPASPEALKHMFKNLSKERMRELMQKYYKGCGTGILFMAPIVAIQNSTALVLAQLFQGQSDVTLAQKTLAAFCAGACSALIEGPADLLVLQRQNPSFKHELLKDTWQRIYKERGLSTFYRGISATCMRDGTITIAYKAGGEIIRKWNPLTTNNEAVDKTLSDMVAAVLAATLSQPADVVSGRMKSDLTKSVYKNCIQTALHIIRKEGIRALYKGLVPRGTRAFLAIPLWRLLTEQEVGTQALARLEKLFKS